MHLVSSSPLGQHFTAIFLNFFLSFDAQKYFHINIPLQKISSDWRSVFQICIGSVSDGLMDLDPDTTYKTKTI